MKNGYDQFFKNARQASTQGGGRKPATPRLNLDLSAEDMDQRLRQRAGIRPKKKKSRPTFPWKTVLFSVFGLMVTTWGILNYEQVDQFLRRVEVNMMGAAMAQNENPAPPATEAAPPAKPEPEPIRKVADISDDEVNHLSRLNERKRELDAREEELNRVESELQVQRVELEKRLKELETMRAKISDVLEERVKSDDEKIDTLVQMYTNMKPPQAAKVFETMDEDLAVELLGRMKKKSAADIMNLLTPEKAQIFSEKYAGYKRR